MIDWDAARIEYVSTGCSYQDIADKYGTYKRLVAEHGRKEEWVEQRIAFRNKTSLEVQRSTEISAVSRKLRFMDDIDKAMGMIELLLDSDEPLPPRDVKSITSALMDIKVLYGFTDEDEKKSEDAGVTVRFIGNDWDDEDDIGGDNSA